MVPVIGESIAFGISGVAESLADSDMRFEFARADVSLVSYDFVNDLLVFKAELPQDMSGIVYEVGLFSSETDPGAGVYNSRMLATFDSDSETWTTGTYQTTNARVGPDSLRLAPAASATSTSTWSDILLDLSGYSNADTFALAMFVGGVAPASVAIRFKTDSANYYTWTIPTPALGYVFLTAAKGTLAATGTPSWANITSIDVVATAAAGGAAAVDFDGLRINDMDSDNPEYVLVAREVLATPYTKVEGLIQEIEFNIPVSIA